MKPVKIRLKRTYTGQNGEEYELDSPSKKKRAEKSEKENRRSKLENKTPAKEKEKKEKAVLADSPLPSRRTNARKKIYEYSSTEDSDDSDIFEEIFLHLKNVGIKVKNSHLKEQKSSSKCPKISKNQTPNISSKKKTLESPSIKKSKKKLLDEFKNTPKGKEIKAKNSESIINSDAKFAVKAEKTITPNDNDLSVSKRERNSNVQTPKKNFIDSKIIHNLEDKRKSVKLDSNAEVNNLAKIPEDSEPLIESPVVKKKKALGYNSCEKISALEVIPEKEKVVNESHKNLRKSLRFTPEKHVPELEKPPEDLILNYKRTPKQTSRYEQEYIYAYTQQKSKVVPETPKRSSNKSRRTSLMLQEEICNDTETTPKRRSTRVTTPLKLSSTKKNKNSSLTTPNSKIGEKLPTTPLEKARLSLHLAAVPEGLPCRQKEYNNILTFVKNKLLDGIGGCMYISGVPGTGKTATVTSVIKNLKLAAKEGEVPDFRYIELNGMRLSDPRKAYVQFWQKLFDREERIPAERAQKALDDWFGKNDRNKQSKTTVLLVDELDLICTKKQDVVYNLLEWPTRTHSRLVVLTIANTMDMPERLFKGRITSRMGLTRLTFMPYTFKQLEEIVLERLKGLDAFAPDAVQLVTRKVAAVSGDARRALDICRRAAEFPAPEETVKIAHIERAIKEMTNSNIVQVIRNCSEMEKLFLKALCDLTQRSNADEVELYEVIDQIESISVLEGIPVIPVASILRICHRLKSSRLIFSNNSYPGVLQRVMLNVTPDDVHYATQT